MAEAVVKGEAHYSNRDMEALMQMDFSRFDAVFREGRNNNYLDRDLTLFYALFAVGHLVYMATFGRLDFSYEDIEDKAGDQGVPYYDEIDASISESFEMVPMWKRVLGSVVSPVMALIVFSMPIVLFQPVSPLLASDTASGVTVVMSIFVVLFFGFVWALSYFMLVVGEVMHDRDEVMAEEIIRITEMEDYDSVLVACGGTHRSGIASYLEEEGWETEEMSTNSPTGEVLLWVDRLSGAVMSPGATVKRKYSKTRSMF